MTIAVGGDDGLVNRFSSDPRVSQRRDTPSRQRRRPMGRSIRRLVTTLSLTLFTCTVAAAPVAAATLKVSSFPTGAEVLIDGVNTGKVTPMNVSLTEGDYVVTVQIPGSGWRADTPTITIGSGNNDLSVTLLPLVTAGPAGPKGDKGDNGDKGDPGTQADPPCFDNFNRYIDCGNGTVTDTVTGLVWLKDAGCLGVLDWATANQAAAALKEGDCSLADGSSAGDWRLPTKSEWEATQSQARALGCLAPPLTNDSGTGCLANGSTSFINIPLSVSGPVRRSSRHLSSPITQG
jgi:hypothetical protein